MPKNQFFLKKMHFFCQKCLVYEEKVVTLRRYSKKETNS